jgi:hypothetical protein
LAEQAMNWAATGAAGGIIVYLWGGFLLSMLSFVWQPLVAYWMASSIYWKLSGTDKVEEIDQAEWERQNALVTIDGAWVKPKAPGQRFITQASATVTNGSDGYASDWTLRCSFTAKNARVSQDGYWEDVSGSLRSKRLEVVVPPHTTTQINFDLDHYRDTDAAIEGLTCTAAHATLSFTYVKHGSAQ